jgi:hypothetical protein
MSRNKTLQSIAASLPLMVHHDKDGNQIMVQRSFLGQALIWNGTHEVGGKYVDPKKWYATQMPLYVNHFKELKKIQRKYGWDAVDRYVAGCEKVKVQSTRVKKETRRSETPIQTADVKRIRPTFKMRWAEFWKRLVSVFKTQKA